MVVGWGLICSPDPSVMTREGVHGQGQQGMSSQKPQRLEAWEGHG